MNLEIPQPLKATVFCGHRTQLPTLVIAYCFTTMGKCDDYLYFPWRILTLMVLCINLSEYTCGFKVYSHWFSRCFGRLFPLALSPSKMSYFLQICLVQFYFLRKLNLKVPFCQKKIMHKWIWALILDGLPNLDGMAQNTFPKDLFPPPPRWNLVHSESSNIYTMYRHILQYHMGLYRQYQET